MAPGAEPLLRSGLVWYRPVFTEGSPGFYATLGSDVLNDMRAAPPPPFSDRSVDFVVEHGRAVDLTRAKPLAGRVVRPVLEIDLPFIAGLSVSDLAQATSDEWDRYREYRDFMRSRLLGLDDAL